MDNEISRWPRPIAESALVVLVPEAENLVGPFREKYDPAAAAGMPAHVTILYPFKAPNEIDESVKGKIKTVLAGFKPFDYAIGDSKRFPSVLYLALRDEEPFRHLTLSIWKMFPETPPYEGKHPDVIPHLTVAFQSDEKLLNQIEKELAAAQKVVSGLVSEVALMDNKLGKWRIRDKFKLGHS